MCRECILSCGPVCRDNTVGGDDVTSYVTGMEESQIHQLGEVESSVVMWREDRRVVALRGRGGEQCCEGAAREKWRRAHVPAKPI